MAAVTRRQYKGAAAQTTIVNALASGDTSATLAATTGWPSGAEPFFVVISPGTASEEKCSATISGSVLTLTRAQDDTTAQSHASGATIYPVFSADDADEANFLASRWTTKGDLVAFDGTDVARLGVGINGYRVTAASGETTGLKYDMPSVPVFADTTARDDAFGGTGEKTLADGQLCYIVAAPKRLQIYNGTAWLDFDAEYTAFTPTWTNLTVGNATQDFTYVRLGKLVHYVGYIQLGSTSSVSTGPTLSLPVTAANGQNLNAGTVVFSDATAAYSIGYAIFDSTTIIKFFAVVTNDTYAKSGNVGATNPFTWTTNDKIILNVTYEAA